MPNLKLIIEASKGIDAGTQRAIDEMNQRKAAEKAAGDEKLANAKSAFEDEYRAKGQVVPADIFKERKPLKPIGAPNRRVRARPIDNHNAIVVDAEVVDEQHPPLGATRVVAEDQNRR